MFSLCLKGAFIVLIFFTDPGEIALMSLELVNESQSNILLLLLLLLLLLGALTGLDVMLLMLKLTGRELLHP